MEFKIKEQYRKARVGILKTAHGEIETPNIAFVATHGKIKLLNKKEHKEAGPELMIANNLKSQNPNLKNLENKVQINNDGVEFVYENKKYKLTPEKSIKIQNDIGADIIFALDECTSPLHSHFYNKEALKRTHKWAEQCLETHKSKQALFGIVQGGIFEDLRKKSSKIIGSMDFDGFGIGGSFGEKQMGEILGWALSGFPEEKPRHLLGIGKIKDIFTAVEQGIDLFDCVIPTREARHGVLYTKAGKINIKKSNLFKTDKLKAQRLAVIHNIQFYKNLFREIREAIADKKLKNLKKNYNLR